MKQAPRALVRRRSSCSRWIVKRWVVVMLFSLSLITGCAEGTVTSAQFVDPETRIGVEYRLVGAHAYLAEFHRTFRVAFPHSAREFALDMDTGGYLLINVYRLRDGRLLCDDGADYVIMDPHRETIEQVASVPPESAEYLGCFDWPQGSTLQFIPAAGRPEQTPLSRRADVGIKQSNPAIQRTASKPANDLLPVCHPLFVRGARFTGLAVADLVSR